MTYSTNCYTTIPPALQKNVKSFIDRMNFKNDSKLSFYLSNNYNLYQDMPTFIVITDAHHDICAFLSIYADNSDEAELSISIDERSYNFPLLKMLYSETTKILNNFNYKEVLLKFSHNSSLKEKIIKNLDAKPDHSEFLMELTDLKTPLTSLPDNFEFKKISIKDSNQLAKLQSVIFDTSIETALNYVNEGLNNPSTITFVIHDSLSDKLVACCSITTDKSNMHLYGLAILEDYQHKGVGTTLLRYIIREAKELDINKISLEVDTENTTAISLYKKAGFKQIEQTDYYKYTLTK